MVTIVRSSLANHFLKSQISKACPCLHCFHCSRLGTLVHKPAAHTTATTAPPGCFQGFPSKSLKYFFFFSPPNCVIHHSVRPRESLIARKATEGNLEADWCKSKRFIQTMARWGLLTSQQGTAVVGKSLGFLKEKVCGGMGLQACQYRIGSF